VAHRPTPEAEVRLDPADDPADGHKDDDPEDEATEGIPARASPPHHADSSADPRRELSPSQFSLASRLAAAVEKSATPARKSIHKRCENKRKQRDRREREEPDGAETNHEAVRLDVPGRDRFELFNERRA
jgi:hypothetical protein